MLEGTWQRSRALGHQDQRHRLTLRFVERYLVSAAGGVGLRLRGASEFEEVGVALRRMNDKRESATLPGDISPARHALGKLLGALLVAASALIGLSAPAFGNSGSLTSSGSHQMLPRLTSPRLAGPPGLPPLPQQSLPGVQGYLSGVSCASVLSCVAVGWSYNKGYTPLILSTSDAGATWITPLAVARMPPVSMP